MATQTLTTHANATAWSIAEIGRQIGALDAEHDALDRIDLQPSPHAIGEAR